MDFVKKDRKITLVRQSDKLNPDYKICTKETEQRYLVRRPMRLTEKKPQIT